MNSSFSRHQDTNPVITLTTQMYIETRERVFLAIKYIGKKGQYFPYLFSSMPVVLSTCRKQPRSLLLK